MTMSQPPQPPPQPPTATATFSRVESSLRSNLDELQVRSEVNACLQDMLLDVETTFALQQQFLLQKNATCVTTIPDGTPCNDFRIVRRPGRT
mmetsp:Transcript_54084/g.131276  ORF Transcript_54084/g.131276 Transcript_54084/m.131276 type:complete len:92 (+) Transcript_54084:119-394(+)